MITRINFYSEIAQIFLTHYFLWNILFKIFNFIPGNKIISTITFNLNIRLLVLGLSFKLKTLMCLKTKKVKVHARKYSLTFGYLCRLIFVEIFLSPHTVCRYFYLRIQCIYIYIDIYIFKCNRFHTSLGRDPV